MEMVIQSTCGVCSATGEQRISSYFPGYQMPPPNRTSYYVPQGWQYIQGITLCSKHTYRIVIERVGQAHGAWQVEIEAEPGAKPQPFQGHCEGGPT